MVKNTRLEIAGCRYFKENLFTATRIVTGKGVYSAQSGTADANATLLKAAGLLPHDNCIPNVAHVKVTRNEV